MTKDKVVEAIFREWVCPCRKGVFRVVGPTEVVRAFDKRWLHKCSACGAEDTSDDIYPILIYKGRRFQLPDANRPPKDHNVVPMIKPPPKFD